MDKKTQALVEQYARSLVEVAFEQDAVSTIQEEVRQILTVFAETNLKTFLSQENASYFHKEVDRYKTKLKKKV